MQGLLYLSRVLFIAATLFPLMIFSPFSTAADNHGYREWCIGTNDIIPFGWLDLSPEQRRRIRVIERDNQKRNWELVGKIMDVEGELAELYDTDTPEPKKIGAAYNRIAKFEQQMIENDVEAWNRTLALLTAEQKKQLKKFNQGGHDPGSGTYEPQANELCSNGTMNVRLDYQP